MLSHRYMQRTGWNVYRYIGALLQIDSDSGYFRKTSPYTTNRRS